MSTYEYVSRGRRSKKVMKHSGSSASGRVPGMLLKSDSEPGLFRQHVGKDASLSMPQGRTQAWWPPNWHLVSYRQPWAIAELCSSLTSAGVGRLQNHIKLSEDPKIPVSSVNSTFVRAPSASKSGCNKAPPSVVSAAPRGRTDTVSLLHPTHPQRLPTSESGVDLCFQENQEWKNPWPHFLLS